MAYMIDSNAFIHQEKNGDDLLKVVAGREEEEMLISAVKASELLHGVHRARSEIQRVPDLKVEVWS
jgi:predicted nucleic acid-binding protein